MKTGSDLPKGSRNGRTGNEIWRGVVCWCCGLGLASLFTLDARANYDLTYEFTANPGQPTGYNGTTIEIEVTPYPPGYIPEPHQPPSIFSVLSIDFFGVAPGSSTPFSSVLSPVTIPSNTDITAATPTGWQGYTGGTGEAYTPEYGNFSIAVGIYPNNVEYGPFFPLFTSQSADGTWSLVPDSSNSFALLATSMLALWTGRFLLRHGLVFGAGVIPPN